MEGKGFEMLPFISGYLEKHVNVLGRTQSQKRLQKTKSFHLWLIFKLSTIMDRTTSQKNNKEIEDLNNTINQLGIIDTYSGVHILLKCSPNIFKD